jgi:hypothetical protein
VREAPLRSFLQKQAAAVRGNVSPSELVTEGIALLEAELAVYERTIQLLKATGNASIQQLRAATILAATGEQRTMILTLAERIDEIQRSIQMNTPR